MCQLRCYYCIHHLDGELPRLEVIRTLETLPDLLETDRCPGYATHEKDSWCCYIASHNPSWEWRKFHLPMWLSNIWLDNLLDKGVTFIWRKSGVPRTRCCPEWRSLSTSVFVHGWKQSEAGDWQTGTVLAVMWMLHQSAVVKRELRESVNLTANVTIPSHMVRSSV